MNYQLKMKFIILVTEHLKGIDPRLRGHGVWLGDNYVLSRCGEKFSEIKARLIANEMRKIEEALGHAKN